MPGREASAWGRAEEFQLPSTWLKFGSRTSPIQGSVLALFSETQQFLFLKRLTLASAASATGAACALRTRCDRRDCLLQAFVRRGFNVLPRSHTRFLQFHLILPQYFTLSKFPVSQFATTDSHIFALLMARFTAEAKKILRRSSDLS